jgi:23S rRNA pseudouridine1911/1915/1917 synthase
MSYYFTLTYPQNLAPCSIGDLLCKLLIPRKWRHYLRIEQKILINKRYRPFNQLIYPGEIIEITLNHVDSAQGNYVSSGVWPDIIYEDKDLLVINKPAGQKTHPNLTETDTALNDCATYLRHTPFIVHRLDMLTSGLLLIAKNAAVVPILNRQLTTKTFHREYLAVVNNSANLKDVGTIDLPIGRDPHDQRKRMVRSDGLQSITHYQVISRTQTTALIKLSLATGRTHQIRVHLAALNSPILGDPLYNNKFSEGEFLHLTAYQMSFYRPFSFEQVSIKLPEKKIRLLN